MRIPHLDELKKILTEKNCNAFISNPKNIFYFTNYMPHATAHAYITVDTQLLYVPALEHEDASKRASEFEIILMDGKEKISTFVSRHILEQKPKTIAIEEGYLTVQEFKVYEKKFKHVKLENISEDINKMRMIKTPNEIARLQEAARITDRAMNAGFLALREGITEFEVAAEIEYEMKKQGSQKVAFDTIVASGSNAALPHATCSNRKIKENEFIIMDIGATFEGYCMDMTRTAFLGKPSSRQKKIYDLVREAKIAAEDGFTNATTPKELDYIARTIINKAGYDFIHSLGHGVGLDVHEKPAVSPLSEDPSMPDGAVFTIEPGIYIPNECGVRLEDTYQVKNGNLYPLTEYPFLFQLN
ncbi:MAG: M24 family metallopeptidase [Candidatus Helarchaeota archaeon]